MRYFLDTEFYEKPVSIELISIGIVAEDGREFYAENTLFNWQGVEHLAMKHHGRTGDTPRWLIENVKPHLVGATAESTPSGIGQQIREFVYDDPDPHFWGWYADYDWVVFCWLQGRMIDLPKGWPKYCRDLKQVVDQLGVKLPHLSKDNREHHALADARELRDQFEWLQDYFERPESGLDVRAAYGLRKELLR